MFLQSMIKRHVREGSNFRLISTEVSVFEGTGATDTGATRLVALASGEGRRGGERRSNATRNICHKGETLAPSAQKEGTRH